MRRPIGAIGVSLLDNFIIRQGQIHRGVLTTHTNHANPFFDRQLNGMIQSLKAARVGATEASHRALAQLSAQVDLQANILGFVNAFWVLGLMTLLLIPLPFIMRRPSPEEAKHRQRSNEPRTNIEPTTPYRDMMRVSKPLARSCTIVLS